MADGPRPHLFTIPPHRPFSDALAAGLIALYGRDPLALARGTILIPNNRAQQAITDAFVRRAEAGGLLLPRLVAIGDPDLDERLGASFDPADSDGLIPPAIDPLERQMILAKLVQETRNASGAAVDAAEAARLAADLGRTLDQLIVEEIPPSRLMDGVPPDLSEHWQSSLALLNIILARWPEELARRGKVDLADRRNRLLRRAAARWREQAPLGFIVAAGITTSAPAVARLLRTVAGLPQGTVVFPFIDCEMNEAEWQALGPHDPDPETGHRPRSIETHPQYHLKLLLDRMGLARGEIGRWRCGWGSSVPALRTRAIGHAMAPAQFTAKWQTLKPAERRVTGVRVAEFGTPGEEAQAIALALREVVETPGRTAALVTPDRGLAQRVVAHLRRWNIDADDSAGTPLSLTPPGALLLAISEVVAEQFAPIPLLAVLKHPLVQAGEQRAAWLEGVRNLDEALRGPRPAPGLDGISRYLDDGKDRERRLRQKAKRWWLDAVEHLAPLADPVHGLSEAIAAVREAADALAGDAIWSGPAGRAAAELIADLEAHAASGPTLSSVDTLPVFLRALMDMIAIRPPQGGHPRIFIWGLIEARLQHADHMILGGLNEGIWPAAPPPDPWLAPAIRRDMGLPGLERRIGLAAHDFATSLGASQVLITRARRDAKSPTLASRFLLRLEAMTGGVTRAPRLGQWGKILDDNRIPIPPATRPAPAPSITHRPRRIAVTKLDRLQADPFAFYADAILGLLSWDIVDADPDSRWRGNAVHAVFEAWMKEDACDPAKLAPRARALLQASSAHPIMRAFWEPRLMEAIDWVADTMRALASDGRKPVAAEIFGETKVGEITLYGKVDRIDQLADGSLAIIDYKTGKPPSAKQVEAGYSMQLGLLGLIAARDGFPAVRGQPSRFEYWSLASYRGKLGYVSSPVGDKKIPPEDFIPLAAATLTAAIEKWLLGDAAFTAKLHPELAPYPDYDQLMRLDEWYGRSDG